MTNQKRLEEYTGFTDEEVKALCERYGMDFAKDELAVKSVAFILYSCYNESKA